MWLYAYRVSIVRLRTLCGRHPTLGSSSGIGLVNEVQRAYRALGQVSENLIERLEGPRNFGTHPGKERQTQDGPRVIISPKQDHSYDPEQGIRKQLE
jgi:hypothetical protein